MLHRLVKNIFLMIFIISLTGLSSCKKESLDGDKSILIGNWNWMYTDHSASWCNPPSWEETLTPSSENKSYTIEFLKNGNARFYRDTELLQEKVCQFREFEINGQGEFSFYIYLDENQNDPLYGSGNGTSIFIGFFPFTPEPGCENYSNYFAKE